jgi:hypothetical protein
MNAKEKKRLPYRLILRWLGQDMQQNTPSLTEKDYTFTNYSNPVSNNNKKVLQMRKCLPYRLIPRWLGQDMQQNTPSLT